MARVGGRPFYVSHACTTSGEQRVVTYVADGDPSRGRHPTEIRSIFHGSPRKSLGGAPLTSILDANLRGAASTRVDNAPRNSRETLSSFRADCTLEQRIILN